MNIFCDYHHAGLARSMYYLFGKRLYHRICFPNVEFGDQVDPNHIWGRVTDEIFLKEMGGINANCWKENAGFISKEEFMDTEWDIILLTRTESQDVMFKLEREHKSGGRWVYLAQSGNENMVYSWPKVKLLLASDEDTYRLCPPTVKKILTIQEIGEHFLNCGPELQVSSHTTVACFINNLAGQLGAATNTIVNDFGTGCPHCGSHPANSTWHPYHWWVEIRGKMPYTTFDVYGHSNEHLGGQNLKDKDMPIYYRRCALVWHVKGFDGWGHSMLQSIACGRPVIIKRGMYRYRAANRYLLPNLTCFEVDSPAEAQDVISMVTKDVDTARIYVQSCWEAAIEMLPLDAKHQAWRVSKWLEEVL